MSPNQLDGYVTAVGQLHTGAVLGHLCLSTVLDGVYPRDIVVERFTDLDLNAGLVPAIATPPDAFKHAVADNRETKYTLENGDVVTLMMRPVTSKNPREYVVYAMMRELRSSQQAALAYDSVGEFHFYPGVRRGGQRHIDHTAARLKFMSVDRSTLPHVDADEWKRIKGACYAIQQDYDRFRTTLDGRKVRAMVLDYLRTLDAIQIKRGVYFVPASRGDELSRLREVVNELGECRLNLVPLPDIADQRELIIRSFEEEEMTDMAALAREIQAAGNEPSLKVFERLRDRFDTISARVKAYEDTLNVSLDHTSGAHDFVRSAMARYAQNLFK